MATSGIESSAAMLECARLSTDQIELELHIPSKPAADGSGRPGQAPEHRHRARPATVLGGDALQRDLPAAVGLGPVAG
jgi:hypothetical protein